MQLIQIDAELCNKDGICVRECPFNLLKEDEAGFPIMIEGAEQTCMRCGHCLAVCSTGALSLAGVEPKTCKSASAVADIDLDRIEKLIINRRSIRVFKDKPVPRAEINRLIDMVRWAPTAKNQQPVNWSMVDDRDTIKTLAGMTVDWLRENQLYPEIIEAWEHNGEDMIIRGAPLLVICHAHKDALNPPVDCTIAMSTLELAASAAGIGGCWAGFFMRAANFHAPLQQFLYLPDNHRVYGALMLGYPRLSYKRIPVREEAKIRWL